jgi:hypothetical protein
MDYFFFSMCGLMLVNVCVFVLISRGYEYQPEIKAVDSATTISPTPTAAAVNNTDAYENGEQHA